MDKKRLIVVGNKPPKRAGLAAAIDSFDFVLRVNRMNHLGPTGSRIDGLFLEANEEFKERYRGGANKMRTKDAGMLLMRRIWYTRFDTWSEYITPIQYNRIEVIDDNPAIRETGFRRLTSSILLLGYLLHSKWSEDYHIHITCLDIENRAMVLDNDPTWRHHQGAGAIEQAYLLKQISTNRITRLNDE